MSDEYNCVANGKLKLKNNAGIKKIKKKKSRKTDDKYLQFNGEKEPQLEFGKNQYHRNNDTTNQNNNSNNRLEMEQRSLTKAEIAFKKQQEKMVSIKHVYIYPLSCIVMLNALHTLSVTSVFWKRHPPHINNV